MSLPVCSSRTASAPPQRITVQTSSIVLVNSAAEGEHELVRGAMYLVAANEVDSDGQVGDNQQPVRVKEAEAREQVARGVVAKGCSSVSRSAPRPQDRAKPAAEWAGAPA